MRYAIVIEYDGSAYNGFQRQKGLPTVQQTLEEALSLKLQEDISVTASGRTDAGVHAAGQVAHFDSSKAIDTSDFGFRLNPLLPRDIAVKACYRVDESFHARFSARRKTYVYRVYLSSIHAPLKEKYNHVCFYDVDIDVMKEACKYLVGEHDFRAFMLSESKVRTTVRTLYEARIDVSEGGRQLEFVFTGNGFLHNMVRSMTGTLIDVGRGRFALSDLPEIIESKKRANAGKTLEGKGLTLISVDYGKPLCDGFVDEKREKVTENY